MHENPLAPLITGADDKPHRTHFGTHPSVSVSSTRGPHASSWAAPQHGPREREQGAVGVPVGAGFLRRSLSMVTQHPQGGTHPPIHPFPFHVRLLNAILCAQCGLPIVPLALIVAWIAYSLYNTFHESDLEDADISVINVWIGVGNPLELAANTFFGFFYWRNQRATELISRLEELGVPAQDSIRSLGRFVWVGQVVSAAVMAGPSIHGRLLTDTINHDPENELPAWQLAVSNSFLYAQMFHLCACWLWSCHAYRRAATCIVEEHISVETVATRAASKTVFGVLAHMHASSKLWAWNHAIRFFTTIALASAYLYYGQCKKGMFDIVWSYTIALTLCAMVWLTAGYPGLCMKFYYGMVQRKLVEIGNEPVPADPDHSTKDTASRFMDRLMNAAPYTGLHFAGIPMTLEKALAAGTVILWWLSQGSSVLTGGGDGRC